MFLKFKKMFLKLLIKQKITNIIFSILIFLIGFDIVGTFIYNQLFINKVFSKNSEIEKKINDIKKKDIYHLIKDTEKAYLIYDTDNFYSTMILQNKDVNETIKIDKIHSTSLHFYEKYFFDNNVSYELMSIQEFSKSELNKFIDKKVPLKTNIEEYQSLLPNLLMFVFVVFVLERSGMIHFGLGNKFKLIFPEDIVGEIDNLIGLDDIKNNIDKIDFILKSNKSDHYKNFNILFSGAPGTGKTKMATYLSKKLNLPLIIGTGNLETGYVAGGSNTIKQLFKVANEIAETFDSKCIIFLDEAQVLLRKRNQRTNNSSKWDDDTTNELLSNLDGVNSKTTNQIIFIAASNFDDSNMEMDEAIERRFQQKLYFRLPNKDEREDIIKLYLEKNDIDISAINISYLSEITAKNSPAKIEVMIKEALLHNHYEKNITTEMLIKSFEIMTIGHTTKEITKNKEEERDIIITHELGHFFCYFETLCKENHNNKENIIKNLDVLKISSESIAKYNALGFVLNSENDSHLRTKNQLENDIIKLYGGVAAEEFFYGKQNVTTGSYNDIEKITEILNLMVNKINIYSDKKINYTLLKQEEKNIEEIERLSELLYKKSKERIQKHKDNIKTLSKILKEKWTLNKNDIILLITEEKIKIL